MREKLSEKENERERKENEKGRRMVCDGNSTTAMGFRRCQRSSPEQTCARQRERERDRNGEGCCCDGGGFHPLIRFARSPLLFLILIFLICSTIREFKSNQKSALVLNLFLVLVLS